MIDPPLWTKEQLEADCLKSSAAFSKKRPEKPLEEYLEAVDEYQGHIEEMLETTADLSQLESTAPDILTNPYLLNAFCDLAPGHRFVRNDLKVLTEEKSRSKGSLQSKPEDVRLLIGIVRQVLDPRRFWWVVEGSSRPKRNAARP